MQMTASRKLIVFFNKIVVRAGEDLPALSVIPFWIPQSAIAVRSAMLCTHHLATLTRESGVEIN